MTAAHCSTLQHTAAYSSTQQRTATHSNTLQQHTVAHCSSQPHTATHSNTLQHATAHGNTWRTRDSDASTQTRWRSRFIVLRYCPAPTRVPPVPAPHTNTYTIPQFHVKRALLHVKHDLHIKKALVYPDRGPIDIIRARKYAQRGRLHIKRDVLYSQRGL